MMANRRVCAFGSPGSLPPLRPNIPGLPAAPVNKDTNADAEVPYYRLYVGNLYYNLSADDIRQVFEPFGELAFVDLPMEPQVSVSLLLGQYRGPC